MGEEGHPETSGHGSSKRRASRGISEFPSLGEIRGPSSLYPEPLPSPLLIYLHPGVVGQGEMAFDDDHLPFFDPV